MLSTVLVAEGWESSECHWSRMTSWTRKILLRSAAWSMLQPTHAALIPCLGWPYNRSGGWETQNLLSSLSNTEDWHQQERWKTRSPSFRRMNVVA